MLEDGAETETVDHGWGAHMVPGMEWAAVPATLVDLKGFYRACANLSGLSLQSFP